MADAQKQLAQLRPANTSTNSAIKRGIKSNLLITSVFICNTTGAAATFSIYMDQNGTTYDATTALFFGVAIAANTTIVLDFNAGGLPLNADTAAGNLAVQSNISSALTFSIYGQEFR